MVVEATAEAVPAAEDLLRRAMAAVNPDRECNSASKCSKEDTKWNRANKWNKDVNAKKSKFAKENKLRVLNNKTWTTNFANDKNIKSEKDKWNS